MSAFSVVPSRSGAVRTFEQRTALEMFAARITAVSLSGYLFFGRWGCEKHGAAAEGRGCPGKVGVATPNAAFCLC